MTVRGIVVSTLVLTYLSSAAAAQEDKRHLDASGDVAAADRSAARRPVRLSVTMKATLAQSLMTERADWQSRNTSIAAPLLFTILGGVALITAVGLAAAYGGSVTCDFYQGTSDDCLDPKYAHEDTGLKIAAISTGVGSAALLGVATGLWLARTSESNQHEQLHRIDNKLRVLGVQARLNPWTVPTPSGAAAGLQLTVHL